MSEPVLSRKRQGAQDAVDTLETFEAFEAFDKGFEAGDAMLEGLTGLGGQRGVAFDEGGFAASAPLMRIQLKALVAQRFSIRQHSTGG